VSLLFDFDFTFVGFVNLFRSTNSPSHVETIVFNELVVEGAVGVLSSTNSPHIEAIVLDELVVVLPPTPVQARVLMFCAAHNP